MSYIFILVILALFFFQVINSIKAKALFSEMLFGNRQPNREDIVNIVHRMYEKDGISRSQVIDIVNTFPNQGRFLFHVMFKEQVCGNRLLFE